VGVRLLPRPQGHRASGACSRRSPASSGARSPEGPRLVPGGAGPGARWTHPQPRAGVDPDARRRTARHADRGARARARHPGLDQARVEREPARAVAEGARGDRGARSATSIATRTARRST
jgi:hypothetical protein